MLDKSFSSNLYRNINFPKTNYFAKHTKDFFFLLYSNIDTQSHAWIRLNKIQVSITYFLHYLMEENMDQPFEDLTAKNYIKLYYLFFLNSQLVAVRFTRRVVWYLGDKDWVVTCKILMEKTLFMIIMFIFKQEDQRP